MRSLIRTGRRTGTRALLAVLALGVLAAPTSWAAKPQPVLKLNVYFASGFDDASYQKAALEKVLKAWKPREPIPAPGKKTVVISTIRRDGALLDAYFNLTSGVKTFDEAALAAVKKAAPFAALPKGYAPETVEAHWHFEVGK